MENEPIDPRQISSIAVKVVLADYRAMESARARGDHATIAVLRRSIASVGWTANRVRAGRQKRGAEA